LELKFASFLYNIYRTTTLERLEEEEELKMSKIDGGATWDDFLSPAAQKHIYILTTTLTRRTIYCSLPNLKKQKFDLLSNVLQLGCPTRANQVKGFYTINTLYFIQIMLSTFLVIEIQKNHSSY
jgi:hypothetical protein